MHINFHIFRCKYSTHKKLLHTLSNSQNHTWVGLSKIFLALVCVLGSALLQSTHAQETPQDYLTPHNIARAAVNVGPLSWDEKLASYAQKIAIQRIDDCNLVRSGGPYGENLAMSTDQRGLSGMDAVNLWVAEKADYNYKSNSCADGKVCGHYTQVVWSNTTRVGCAKVWCNSGGTLIGCNYDPPGNYVGQKPYNLYVIILPCAKCMDAPIIFTIDDIAEQESY
ncbi:pathogenesis-related protein 1 [Prunus yedoensis var. nudiflora]|uniref:Pathogenesis-related protein 1 n=1 Tax=Prunus yedoensis var. nudiflora TaxID=2094558 RepID=A0A314U6X6_PRUYE|nr:pathogenesis-related protein 1 [Prunus yedoensis var. nudiflora]